jgi:arsenite methyltransferase
MIVRGSLQTQIQDYYGRVLESNGDLRTGACCDPESLPPHLRSLAGNIHPEVQDRFYGCGVPIPSALKGATVLDLGCGTGRDCYILSQLVGPEGRVIGVDMTEEQLSVARRHLTWHMERFGLSTPNIEFRLGYMEDLASLGLEEEPVDVVVSNCVFNLSPDKPRLFAEVLRVLRPGGELLFSDVFADRRVPTHLKDDPALVGECLAGALYQEDLRRILDSLGCTDVREVRSHPVEIHDPDLESRIGMVKFHARTLRAFKLELEDRCEDYGQVATYRGTLEGSPHAFQLDAHHRFETGRPDRVCGNTARILSQTRYARHFEVTGDESVHFGLFDCVAPGTGEIPSAACC